MMLLKILNFIIKYKYWFLLLLLLLIIFAIYYFFKLKEKRIKKKIYNQAKLLDEFEYITSISGAIGAGKTTSAYGLTHLYTIKFNNDIKKKLKLIKLKNYKIDFSKLNKFLFVEYQKKFIYDIKLKLPILNIKDNERPHLLVFEKVKDNSDYKKIKADELLEYVYLLYKLFLGRFVMSNNRVKNFLTNNYAKFLNESDFNLKDVKLTKDFALDKYVLTFIDEQLLNNINLNQREEDKKDTGKREFLRLIRHLFEEKLFYLSTEQNFLRLDKDLRELYNTNLFVYKMKIIITKKIRYEFYKFLSKVLEKVITIVLAIKTFSLRNSKDVEVFKGNKLKELESRADRLFYKSGKYKKTKKILLFLYKKQLNIIETSLVKYKYILNKIDAEGNPIPVKKIKLLFYYNWCFKAGDTHYYKFISEVLQAESIINYDTTFTHDFPLMWEEKVNKTEKILKKKVVNIAAADSNVTEQQPINFGIE